MDNLIVILSTFAVGVFITTVFGFLLHLAKLKRIKEEAELHAEKVMVDAREGAEKLITSTKKEIKEENKKRRNKFELEAKQRRSEVSKLESKVRQREQSIDKKLSILDEREKKIDLTVEELDGERSKFKSLSAEYEKNLEHSRQVLQDISKMTAEEAKEELVRSIEKDARKAAAEKVKEIEEETKLAAQQRAQSLVTTAIQRMASDFVNDTTVTVVSIPSDELKGRIIGREGRNIRSIEQATGVDLIIDDTPEAVIVSCFNPVRREIAKKTLERLIEDGRIHPARISETVKRVEQELDATIEDYGEQAAFDVGISDLQPRLIQHIGKLHFRSTGQQSVLRHSIEVAHICSIMAAELKLDVKVAARIGLLHDIGKALDQEHEGHHAEIGSKFCEKYNESPVVCKAIRSHHDDDLTHATPYGVILHAANMLSANRPGARKELLEGYIERLESLESLVGQFEGIDKAYVLKAGREIRALVSPQGMNDQNVTDLTHNIAARIRSELTYPGQVKVTVLRESLAVDLAK